jgi:DNA modification methylase
MSIFDRDFSEHDDLPNKIKNVTQVAKLVNWNEYFKREIELLKNPLILGELFINRYKYLGKLPHQLSNLALLNGLSISGKLRKYSTFDNTGMVQFIDKYKPSIILDPCAGWGERLLTCHQYEIKYYGYDINENTVNRLNKLIDKYQIDAEINCIDSSKIKFNKSDCLFTCPPYWNTEIYTDKGAENLSYKKFLNWWKTVIKKSNCKIVAYQINQKYKDDMNQQIIDLGYTFVEEIILPQKSSHFTRKDGNQKKEYESIQVFIM